MNVKARLTLKNARRLLENVRANAVDYFVRTLVIILLLSFVTACARPVGDLGRAAASATHDEIMPAIGKWRARASKEPASNLNWTDEENEMHDRVWRFLVAPHAKDWFYDILVEWQRTRLLPPQDKRFKHDRYYAHLRSEEYRSSKIRYTRVLRDMEADLNMTPDAFASICDVLEINRRRDEAVKSLRGTDTVERMEVDERKAENRVLIDWFVRALRYRYESYSLALEGLLIETPHQGAREIDGRLSVMAIDVERAEQREFCGATDLGDGNMSGATLPSRLKDNPLSPGPLYRK